MAELIKPNETLEFIDLDPAIAGLVWALPMLGASGKWSRVDRERWINAFRAVCDLLYPDPEPTPEEAERAGQQLLEHDSSPVQTPVLTGEKPRVGRPRKTTVSISATHTTEEEQGSNGEGFGPMPYRGAKEAAHIVLEIIRRGNKPGIVWLNSEGRVKVAGPDYQAQEGDRRIGIYTPQASLTMIRDDLKKAGVELDDR